MKNLICILIATLILTSCKKPTPVEKLITDYEQTTGSTKTDLSLKIISLEKIQDIKVKDSIRILKMQLTNIMWKSATHIEDTLTWKKVEDYARILKERWEKILMSEYANESDRQHWKEMMSMELEAHNLSFDFNHYEKMDTAKIIAKIYKCTYSIKNPFLNGVNQQITKEYLVNSGETQILKDSSKE